MKLIIGNKRLSSWSLRPWLILTNFEIPFEEVLIPLDQPDTTKKLLQFSPTAKVPVLIDDELQVWDSIAIAEYLHEKYPEKKMWPQNVADRARARSISAEMHGGFTDLRHHLSHDLQKNLKDFDWSAAKKDIERIKDIWTACLSKSGGPYLFGTFTIADAMFAPVVNRFVSYGVPVDGLVKKYVENMRANKSHLQWIQAGMAETYIAKFH